MEILNNYKMIKLVLKNASYSIKQGLRKTSIANCGINTQIVDLELLRELVEFPSQVYGKQNNIPYIKIN